MVGVYPEAERFKIRLFQRFVMVECVLWMLVGAGQGDEVLYMLAWGTVGSAIVEGDECSFW